MRASYSRRALVALIKFGLFIGVICIVGPSAGALYSNARLLYSYVVHNALTRYNLILTRCAHCGLFLNDRAGPAVLLPCYFEILTGGLVMIYGF